MKTICSNFTIKIPLAGPVSMATHGKLVGVHAPEPKEAKTKLVSPDESHEPMKQYYIPESFVNSDKIPFTKLFLRGDCDTAIVEIDPETNEKTVTVIPKGEVAAATASDLPLNIMDATIHSNADADEMMFPIKDAQSYVFYPLDKDPDDALHYQIIHDLIANYDLAFCAVVNLQNHEGLFRLSVWRDRIVLVKQSYPEAVNPHESPAEGEFPAAPTTTVAKLADTLLEARTNIDFETYQDRALAAKIALKDGVENGIVAEKPKKLGVLEALEAFLDSKETV